MAADKPNNDPVLARYILCADEAMAKATETVAREVSEEYLRIALQWLLLAEEYIKNSS